MRIDNTDPAVIESYNLKFNPNDPGETEPVDLCDSCWFPWRNYKLEIDHPYYLDGEYFCLDCGDKLPSPRD